MPADYQCLTIAGELPPTATYPKPGQRLYYVKAPGVLQWDADNRPVSFCLMDVDILQQKGRQRADHEAYHVRELTYEEVRNLPRDQYGRPALGGYEFAKYTSGPNPEEPGIYRVATGADGRAYWCSCLGACGHRQTTACKHKSVTTDLADQSAPDRNQTEVASDGVGR